MPIRASRSRLSRDRVCDTAEKILIDDLFAKSSDIARVRFGCIDLMVPITHLLIIKSIDEINGTYKNCFWLLSKKL
jgi:hypothetical protein